MRWSIETRKTRNYTVCSGAEGYLIKRSRLCKNSEAHPYVVVEREQRHSILELDDQFFDFSHRLGRFLRRFNRRSFSVVSMRRDVTCPHERVHPLS